MNINKPNRTRSRDADPNEAQQKKSGDQHTLPIDEPDEDRPRPQRINRQDTQKALPGDTDRNGPGST